MEYYEAVDFLFGLRRFRPKPGTETTAELLSHLGNPHETVDFVQIAGSNGKGSTARMLERTLREAGLSVGVYTSPHLEDLRERVRVDGRKIPRSAVTTFANSAHDYVIERGSEGNSPTFFETMTSLALWYFGTEDVDVAVLEVGIGGKFDATSVVDPIASAVTSVTLEHTGILGETREAIARDKAHVAPDNAPLVTGVAGETLAAVRDVAGDVVTVGGADADGDPDIEVVYRGRANHIESEIAVSGSNWGVETRIPLPGKHQAENAGIAATLARQVADVDTADLSSGLRSAHWPGRFEVIDTEPLVILDGAHNPGACKRVAETLSTYEYDNLHLVFGAMHDKDHREMAPALPTPSSVVTCEPAMDRAEDRDVLAEVFDTTGVDDVRTEPAVPDAIAGTLERATESDAVLVTGSLFTVAEARSRWTSRSVPKRITDLEDADATLSEAGVTEQDVYRSRGKAVHRVIRTDLQYRQATTLKQELLSLGGECALSGFRRDGQRTDAVLMGTLAQFERLTDRLESQTDGLAEVARELRATLGFDRSSGETRHPWQERTAVMGILNVTPDSFHDGGEYDDLENAFARAEAMVEAGADVIDVGGESTRPGADPVSPETERDRVVPVLERLVENGLADEVSLSVDTRRAEVAEAALAAGADIINDVSGLSDPDMRFVAAEYDAPLVLMHSIDAPVVPGREIDYDDVLEDVIDELAERVLLAEKAGLDREQIIVDPGLGFGKAAHESFELLGRLEELHALGCPVLIGHSHKSMFDPVAADLSDRFVPTIAASALAAERGADIVRVHDVPETVAAVKTALAARDPSSIADSPFER